MLEGRRIKTKNAFKLSWRQEGLCRFAVVADLTSERKMQQDAKYLIQRFGVLGNLRLIHMHTNEAEDD